MCVSPCVRRDKIGLESKRNGGEKSGKEVRYFVRVRAPIQFLFPSNRAKPWRGLRQAYSWTSLFFIFTTTHSASPTECGLVCKFFFLFYWYQSYHWYQRTIWMRCIFTNRTMEWHHFLLVPIEPLVPMDHRNCLVPNQATWETNPSPLNEMHIHQLTEPLEWHHFLLVPILPLAPMDHQFDESYPFVYIGLGPQKFKDLSL